MHLKNVTTTGYWGYHVDCSAWATLYFPLQISDACVHSEDNNEEVERNKI